MVAAFVNDDNFEGTWFEGYQEKDFDLYLTSFYWATTTVTTVGYGDITGTNNLEMIFCTIV